MTTAAKLLAQKRQLIERLQEDGCVYRKPYSC
jgi:hypothetical protein